jgi:Spy/CpxP family protein refolding chaperone
MPGGRRSGPERPETETAMKRALITLAGVAGVVALAGWGACGRPDPHNPAEMAAFVNARVNETLDDLSATDAQRTQIHAIVNDLLAKGQQLHQGSDEARAEVLAQWQSPNPDRARLHALVDQRFDAMRAFAHQAVDSGVQVHDALTPEQRTKLTAKIQAMHRWAH